MKQNYQKKYYQKPAMVSIKIDKDISLVMMSVPPGDPFEASTEHDNSTGFPIK